MSIYNRTSQAHPFGQFKYRDLSGGRIEIDPAWTAANLTQLKVAGNGLGDLSGRILTVHVKAYPNFDYALRLIKDKGLGALVKQYSGCWVARHKLWNPNYRLSNHSIGTAIDLNAATNPYGADPTQVNITLFKECFKPAGFSFGGYWARNTDGMHFELVEPIKIVTRPDKSNTRVIIAKPTGVTDPDFAYKSISSLFDGGVIYVDIKELAAWLGKTFASDRLPIRAALKELGVKAEINVAHLKDVQDPRIYVFVKE